MDRDQAVESGTGSSGAGAAEDSGKNLQSEQSRLSRRRKQKKMAAALGQQERKES